MTLEQARKARDFLVNQTREMAVLRKRFETVNKTRQPVWYSHFEKVLKQKMYDEILISMKVHRHSLQFHMKKYEEELKKMPPAQKEEKKSK